MRKAVGLYNMPKVTHMRNLGSKRADMYGVPEEKLNRLGRWTTDGDSTKVSQIMLKHYLNNCPLDEFSTYGFTRFCFAVTVSWIQDACLLLETYPTLATTYPYKWLTTPDREDIAEAFKRVQERVKKAVSLSSECLCFLSICFLMSLLSRSRIFVK